MMDLHETDYWQKMRVYRELSRDIHEDHGLDSILAKPSTSELLAHNTKTIVEFHRRSNAALLFHRSHMGDELLRIYPPSLIHAVLYIMFVLTYPLTWMAKPLPQAWACYNFVREYDYLE